MDLISPVSGSPEDEAHLPELKSALVKELESRGLVAVLALLPVLIILWATIRRVATDNSEIHGLLIAIVIVGFLRILFLGKLKGSPLQRFMLFSTGSTLVAVLLSIIIWISFPNLSPVEIGLVGMIAAGLGSAALISMAPSPVAYWAYILLILGSLGVSAHLHPVPDHPLIFQSLVWLFLISLAGLSLRVHRSVRDGFLLGFKNHELALRDTLTGLHNRRFLNEFMAHETAMALRGWNPKEQRNTTLKLVMVDLDHFKQVNDKYGHAAGDAVLKQLATLMRDTLRTPDVLIRWGGEEFLIIARDTGRTLPLGLAERIRRQVEAFPFRLPDGTILHRTCSLGFSLYPFLPSDPSRLNWEQCVAMADAGLYMAKEGGRNRWIGLEAGEKAWPDDESIFNQMKGDPKKSLQEGLLRLIQTES